MQFNYTQEGFERQKTGPVEPGEIYVYTTFAFISPWVEPNIIIQGKVNP
jgi:hypothetical protein